MNPRVPGRSGSNPADDGTRSGIPTVDAVATGIPTVGTLVAERSDPVGRSTRRRGSGTDLLRSMLVLGVLVVGAVLLFPRPGIRPVASVDVAALAAANLDRAGFELLVPRGLPPDWTATSARLLDGTDHTPSWRVTYRTGAGHPVGFIQGHRPTRAWENHMVVDGRENGTTTVDGTIWVFRSRADRGTTNLVLRSPEQTLVVTGRADPVVLEALARSLLHAASSTRGDRSRPANRP